MSGDRFNHKQFLRPGALSPRSAMSTSDNACASSPSRRSRTARSVSSRGPGTGAQDGPANTRPPAQPPCRPHLPL